MSGQGGSGDESGGNTGVTAGQEEVARSVMTGELALVKDKA